MSAIEYNAGRELVDAKPLQDAIKRDAHAELAAIDHEPGKQNTGIALLAVRIGVDERILRRVLVQRRVSIDVADKYCCAVGRLLADLYPEAYSDDEGFTARCEKCRADVDHDILYESSLRMKLRCRDCGRRRYVHRFPRTRPSNAFTAFPVATETLARDYQAGMTLRQVADKHGFSSESTVRVRLLKAGITPRPRGPRDETKHLSQLAAARGRRIKSARSKERAAPVLEMWSQGLPASIIAERLGMSAKAVYDTIHNQRLAGVDVPYRKRNGRTP